MSEATPKKKRGRPRSNERLLIAWKVWTKFRHKRASGKYVVAWSQAAQELHKDERTLRRIGEDYFPSVILTERLRAGDAVKGRLLRRLEGQLHKAKTAGEVSRISQRIHRVRAAIPTRRRTIAGQ